VAHLSAAHAPLETGLRYRANALPKPVKGKVKRIDTKDVILRALRTGRSPARAATTRPCHAPIECTGHRLI